MKRPLLASGLALILVLAACNTPTPTPTPTPTIPPSPTAVPTPTVVPTSIPTAVPPTPTHTAHLNQPFPLRMGEQVTLADANNLRVSFTTLLEDSRCPTDANCIQVGRARVAITVESGSRLARFELSTFGYDLNSGGAFDGYFIRLMNVSPLPTRVGVTVPPSDYSVQLLVKPGNLDVSVARFNEPFTLKLGQSVGFESSTLRLTFESVQQDSRCPVRVVCATSGTAILTLVAYQNESNQRYNLTVGGSDVMTQYPIVRTVAGRLRATALTPYPQQDFASKEIAPNEYQATLIVINPVAAPVSATPTP